MVEKNKNVTTHVEPQNKKPWPHPAKIKHWSGLVSELELLMSYLHFVI